MTLARITSAAVRGVDSYLVDVEVNLASGLPSFSVVGLPQSAVREGRERVLAALANSGHPVPPRRVTVNLAPADVRKEGSAFDLPIAVGLLVGSTGLEGERVAGHAFVGELGLDGTVRPIRGALSVAERCLVEGVEALVVPEPNAREAACVVGLQVLGVRTMSELLAHLDGRRPVRPTCVSPQDLLVPGAIGASDLADVKGQEAAKRALEVAAAGAHNLLMLGPPGSGKTMLARRIPGIMPPLSLSQALEVTKVHSVAGRLPAGGSLVSEPPFRAPHHTISEAGLVGGGGVPRPGEVSLAHHGVLFLDELPEFRRHVLEGLRQPLEDGSVRLARARESVSYPARFMLVASMNPCPCGYHGQARRCTCDPGHVARYRARISGPLLDRLDIHLSVPAVPFRELTGERCGEPSARVRERVTRARDAQRHRLRMSAHVYANGQMGPPEIRRWCRPDARGARLLREAVDRLELSARAYHRILKLARTIADLDGRDCIDEKHIAEAVQYRSLDRRVAMPG